MAAKVNLSLDVLTSLCPDPAYRNKLNPFSRKQPALLFSDMFPVIDGRCSCGCGTKLRGRQRRWSNPDHWEFPSDYYKIICGYSETIRYYIYLRDQGICRKCDGDCDQTNTEWQADHIIEVREGGGGCFLDNYQTLCSVCHKQKTRKTGRKLAKK